MIASSLSSLPSGVFLVFLFMCVRSTFSDPSPSTSALSSSSPDSSDACGSEFRPLPGTRVHSGCKWDIRLNTVLNRIPSTITEIFCRTPNSTCGRNTNYQCRQIRAKMVVAFTDHEANTPLTLLHRQNITFSLGCSCVQKHSTLLSDFLSYPQEKRSSL